MSYFNESFDLKRLRDFPEKIIDCYLTEEQIASVKLNLNKIGFTIFGIPFYVLSLDITKHTLDDRTLVRMIVRQAE